MTYITLKQFNDQATDAQKLIVTELQNVFADANAYQPLSEIFEHQHQYYAEIFTTGGNLVTTINLTDFTYTHTPNMDLCLLTWEIDDFTQKLYSAQKTLSTSTHTQYRITSELFGQKERIFDTKKEAVDFAKRKTKKIATAKANYIPIITNQPIPDIDKLIIEMQHQLLSKIQIEELHQMDIRSKSNYPSNKLSNFAPNGFIIDNIQCNSMEGFLQSLKTKNPDSQKQICLLVGKAAKEAGAKKNWKKKQTLYWQGVAYKRDSQEYTDLITRAFDALSQNTAFQNALLATGNANITHSIGKKKKSETVLTKQEFTKNLHRLRNILQSKQQGDG